MVNKEVLNYLKENKDKYALDSLKQKILSAGYRKAEFKEAVRVLGMGENKFPPKVTGSPGVVVSKGVKWMKIGAIAGLVLTTIFALNFVLGYFGKSLFVFGGEVFLYVSLFVLGLLNIVFYYGFVKLSKPTYSKLLRISSWVLIAADCLVIVLIFSFLIFPIGSSPESFGASAQAAQPAFSPFTGLATQPLNLDSPIGSFSPSAGIEAFMVFAFTFVFVGLRELILNSFRLLFLVGIGTVSFVFAILFSMALIKIKERVRFACSTGILGVITNSLTFLVWASFFILLFSSPKALAGVFVNFLAVFSSEVLGWIVYTVFYLALIGISLLGSLVLLDGSKKFERRKLARNIKELS